MKFEFDLPSDVFDPEFREGDFASRLRELAILELLRVKRLHEHEAQQMLGLERRELLKRMEAVGITPTEKLFGAIKGQLERAINSAERRRADTPPGNKKS